MKMIQYYEVVEKSSLTELMKEVNKLCKKGYYIFYSITPFVKYVNDKPQTFYLQQLSKNIEIDN